MASISAILALMAYVSLDLTITLLGFGLYRTGFGFDPKAFARNLSPSEYSILTSGFDFLVSTIFRFLLLLTGLVLLKLRKASKLYLVVLGGVSVCSLSFSLVKVSINDVIHDVLYCL